MSGNTVSTLHRLSYSQGSDVSRSLQIIRQVSVRNNSPSNVTILAVPVRGGALRSLGAIDSGSSRVFSLSQAQGHQNGDLVSHIAFSLCFVMRY